MNWLILTLVLLQTVAAQAQTSASAKQLAKQGASLMGQNKIDAAIEKYTQAIKLSPNYADAYVKRGLARRTKGDLTGAVDDYEKATSIDPKSVAGNRFVAEAYSNRGFIKLGDLDVDSAIEDFTKAINIHPKEQREYYRRGYARLIKEDLTPALDDLNTALSLVVRDDFSKFLIYAARGMVKALQGKNFEAQMDFDECAKLDTEGRLQLQQHLWSIEVEIKRVRERRSKQHKTIALASSANSNLTPSSIPITLSPAPARQSNTSQN